MHPFRRPTEPATIPLCFHDPLITQHAEAQMLVRHFSGNTQQLQCVPGFGNDIPSQVCQSGGNAVGLGGVCCSGWMHIAPAQTSTAHCILRKANRQHGDVLWSKPASGSKSRWWPTPKRAPHALCPHCMCLFCCQLTSVKPATGVIPSGWDAVEKLLSQLGHVPPPWPASSAPGTVAYCSLL
jgi:hypothetical protein